MMCKFSVSVGLVAAMKLPENQMREESITSDITLSSTGIE